MNNVVPSEVRLVLGVSLGRKSSKVINLLHRWIKCSGTEWTCVRLKAIRTAALQLRAGHPEIAREIYQENSIRYDKRTLVPKGPFGILVENFIRAMRPVAIRRADACLRIYTALRLDTLSANQFRKAYNAITKPPDGHYNYSKLCESIRQLTEKVLARHVGKLVVPDIGNLKGFTACHREIPIPEDLRDQAYSRVTASLLTSVWIPEALRGCNPCEELRLQLQKDGAEPTRAGHIAFIQEGGCKARVVAVPNAWCQWLFQPLHRLLDNLVKRLPNSSVHDQNAGGYFLKEYLSRGVYCFDLSSATDRFPLPLQQSVLRGLHLDRWAEAMGEMSQGRWSMTTTFFEGEVSYGAGQPMGLYGSFPLFHLTHWILLLWIERLTLGKKFRFKDLHFYVLGDDVVITDRMVARNYARVLDHLGVPTSPTKTIQSDRVGEFAGFVVMKTNRMNTAYRPYKSHREGSHARIMNLMYSLGSPCMRINGWWRRNYPLFVSTLSQRQLDLSPIYVEHDIEGKAPGTIDSHLLGSQVNRLAYDLPYFLSDDFNTLWYEHRLLLLGQKERLSSSGNPLKNLNPVGIRDPQMPDANEQTDSFGCDPLIREARERMITLEDTSSTADTKAPEVNTGKTSLFTKWN